MIVNRPDGRLVVVTGASRSGKTLWTSQQVARERRLLVWDLIGEWSVKFQCRRVAELAELRECVKPAALVERIAYHRAGMVADFDTFCRLAWVWIRAARGALVIEEMASVTHPGKAPAAWGDIVRAGLRYGPSIYALTQRPSESDKTAIGNATVLHTHAMARASDRAYMAAELDCDRRQVDALRPLQWVERDRRSGQLRSGTVAIRRR